MWPVTCVDEMRRMCRMPVPEPRMKWDLPVKER